MHSLLWLQEDHIITHGLLFQQKLNSELGNHRYSLPIHEHCEWVWLDLPMLESRP